MKFQKYISLFLVIVVALSGVTYSQTFPEVREFFAPPYPPAARAVRAEGDVLIAVEVDESGKIVAANAVGGHPLLRAAAKAAAMKWSFSQSPLRNFLVLRFQFRLADNKDKKKAAVRIGNYTLRIIEPQNMILQTVSYS